ncbi:MAG: M23 family metallopeptidase [Prevotellaceae bacterium]|nr:M23 family metallopeptidase [Prevotellaceae bacterium]
MLNIISSLLVASWLTFGSPVNYPISLAGNFGEPRPNHFHGGIDVRTGQVEGKPIFSVADGYVSRITVGLYGFGNAVYITHPGGITSVYCHLKKFTPQLAAIVKKWQYKHKTCVADVRLRPTEFPVSIGQFIAVSGNTGASKAPHLHLEFHETKSWNMLDPLEYLMPFVTDTTQPIAHSFMAYPIEGKGLFCGSTRKQSYGFSSPNLSREFTAWGKVGFGIWANDYMEGSFGILGIRSTTLSVDGNVVFESNVDNIPMSCNRMVNSWGDYDHYCRTHNWYMKSFAEPGNLLPVLHTSDNRGVVDFNEEREYHLVYTVSDVFGNNRQYSFNVTGRKQNIPEKKCPNLLNVLRYDRVNDYQRPGLSLNIRIGSLPDDVEIFPKRKTKEGGLSDVWSFYPKSYPLFAWGKIRLKLKGNVKNPQKLYIVCHYGYDRYMGGTYENGWVTGNIRELGASYEIAYDDAPPVISGFSQSGDKLRIATYDNKSGLKSFHGYIDGHFVLFEKVEKSNMLVCSLKESPIKKTGNIRNLKFVATDNCNNKRIFTAQIKY